MPPLGFVVHGIAALAIILFILLIVVLGVISFFRIVGRGVGRARDRL